MPSLYSTNIKDRERDRQRRIAKLRKLGIIEGSNKWYELMYRKGF